MRVLFVHQGFPGQYRHILASLARQASHQIVCMGCEALSENLPQGVQYLRYTLGRGNSLDSHPWVVDTESKVLRGEACADAAFKLRQEGFVPDIICAHPGWGEALFLKDIFPTSPLLCYQEFFYQPRGVDFDFDPEFQPSTSWQDCAFLRMKNANLMLNLDASDWNVTPTLFQKNTFPLRWRDRISCIHDGIDTNLTLLQTRESILRLPDSTVLKHGEPIVTFVSRNLEPYRGCHTFLRSLPRLLELQPNARIVIVGDEDGVGYGKPAPSGTWKDIFMSEIEAQIDPTRIHFTGSLPYQSFLKLLKITAVHVYLTYPFVLSWSLLEAMSSQAPVVASRTAPVQELINHGENGLLVDFFSPQSLAQSVDLLLRNRRFAEELGEKARKTILQRYSLNVCLPQQLALMQLVASRALS